MKNIIAKIFTTILIGMMVFLNAQTINRYGVEYDMPVGIELKIGKNWLDLEEVDL